MHKRDDLHDTCTLITNNTMFRCTTSHNNMYLEYIFRVRQSCKRGNNILTYGAKFVWNRKASEPIHQCRKTSFVVQQNTELCLSRDPRQKRRCDFCFTLPHCLHLPSCRRRCTQWCLNTVFCSHTNVLPAAVNMASSCRSTGWRYSGIRRPVSRSSIL